MKSTLMRQTALATTIGGLVLAVASSGASAQVLEEIIVTAQRRAESQQTVPVSVSAIGSSDIESLGWDNPADIAAQVPNMQVSSPYGGTQPIFVIRGVSMSDYNPNQASPIGVYADEGYLGTTFLHGLSMFDVERIEVLRGPQGTLYGKNTTGGAINIITRTPQIDDAANGYVTVGVGDYGYTKTAAAFEGTLIDGKLAVRVAATKEEDDGYWANANGPDMNQKKNWSGRLVFNWQPSDTFDAVLKITHGDASPRHAVPRVTGTLGPGLNIAGFAGSSVQGTHGGAIDRPGTSDITMTNTNFKMQKVVGDYDLISVTNYYKGEYFQQTDTDGSPANLASLDWGNDSKAWSEDLRLQSNFDGEVNFIAGLYYGVEEMETAVNNIMFNTPLWVLRAANLPQATLLEQFGSAHREIDQTKTSMAAYGQVEFEVNDQIGIDIGLRYTIDKNDRDRFLVQRGDADLNLVGSWIPRSAPFFPGIDAPVVPPGHPALCLPAPSPFCATGIYTNGPLTSTSAPARSVEEKEWSGKISIDYSPTDNAMLYASYSRGFRAGSFNGGLVYWDNANEDGTYASPEFVDAFEIGFKSEFQDGRIRLNGAAFQYDYTDQQFVNQVGISALLENAGGAEIRGVEFELLAAVSDRLTLQAGLGILDTEYTELSLKDLGTPDPFDNVDLAGNELISSPDLSFNFAADYEREFVGDTFLRLHLDGNYQGDQWYSAYNDYASGTVDYGSIRQDGYWLIGARATVAGDDDNWAISLWSSNLLDEAYDAFAINLQGGFGFDYFMEGAPRRYGVEFTGRF